jgi:hypothetical protein
MNKKEKYSSFHEMKDSTTSINSVNATEVMKRHAMFDTFMGHIRDEQKKNVTSKNHKPTPKG